MTNKELVPAFNPKSLLISLHHFYPTPYVPNRETERPVRNYVELNKFRQKIEEEMSGPHHRPYQAGRKKTLLYRTIFYGLGLLFVFLSFFIYSQTMTWAGSVIFVNYAATKIAVCMFTFILGVLSCFVGYSIRTEKEAANQLVHRAKAKINRILSYKKAEFGLPRLLYFGPQLKKHMAAKEMYHDALEKIQESKKTTHALLEQIAKTKDLESALVEKLFNQAILELNDKLHQIIGDFKKNLHHLLEA